MQLFLGTRLAGNLNLVAQLLMLVGLWIGFYFAHTHQIARHRRMQMTVVITNSFFIAFVMVTSFYSYVVLGGTITGTVALLMMIHGMLGLLAELTGIYLILRMRTQLIPPRLRVRNFKLVMRSLLGLWTLIVVLGLGIYYFRYLAAPATAAVPPITHLQSEADALAVHADELQAAALRGNLATTRRHAEHLINLIEGRTGADYGDVDHDGVVEDPGDGVGVFTYLQQVREDATKTGENGAQVEAIAGQVQSALIKIIADAKVVARAGDPNAVAPQVEEIGALAKQVDRSATNSVRQIAQLLGVSTTLPPIAPANAGGAPGSVTINMQDLQFMPETLTIGKGTTIVFVNLDNAKHTVKEDTGKFDSKDIPPGGQFTFTFNEAGTFSYHCEFHGDTGGVDMAGRIIVQ